MTKEPAAVSTTASFGWGDGLGAGEPADAAAAMSRITPAVLIALSRALFIPLPLVDEPLSQDQAALHLGPVPQRGRPHAFPRAGGGADGEGRGLRDVARLMVADENSRGEDVPRARGVGLLARQAGDLLDPVARVQRQPLPAAGQGHDGHRGQELARALPGPRD